MADNIRNSNISQEDRRNNYDQTMTVRFRRPRQQSGTAEELIFPPTVYTDAKYTKGILIPAVRSNDNDNDRNAEDVAHDDGDTEEVALQIPEDYFRHDNETRDGNNDNLLPTLSQNEVAAWNHNIAAFSAAKRRFPMQVARLLGTITLHFKGGTSLYKRSEKYCQKNDSAAKKPTKDDSDFTKNFSKKEAMNEARLEMELDEDVDVNTLPLDVQGQLKTRAEEIFQFWKKIRESAPIQECWSRKYGS